MDKMSMESVDMTAQNVDKIGLFIRMCGIDNRLKAA